MPWTRYKTVEFDHNDHTVVARVYLGRTASGGDDRDEVLSLNVSGKTYLSKAEQAMYEEMALIEAKNQD